MLRRSLPLFIALAFLCVCVSIMVWSDRETSRIEEALRMARSRHQLFQQQVNMMRAPATQRRLPALQEDLDALGIRLVEMLAQLPRPAGVLSVDFEQQLLSDVLDDGKTGPVSVLRLELRMIVQHAIGFLSMLARIDDGVDVWPHETQACRIQRIPRKRLQVECALDFYHWDTGARQVSLSPEDRGWREGLAS